MNGPKRKDMHDGKFQNHQPAVTVNSSGNSRKNIVGLPHLFAPGVALMGGVFPLFIALRIRFI
jgi:hypothetical protein